MSAQKVPPAGRWFGTRMVDSRFHLLTPSPYWREADFMKGGEVHPVWFEGRVAACSIRQTHTLREGGPFEDEFVRRQMRPWRDHNWRIEVFDTPQVRVGLHLPPESKPTWGGGEARACGHCMKWFERVRGGEFWPDRRFYSAWRRREENGMFRLRLRGEKAQRARDSRWGNENAPLTNEEMQRW